VCVCVVITIAVVMLLRDFGPYGIISMGLFSYKHLMLLGDFVACAIIFMTMHIYCYRLSGYS
jgi:hypothetical protein